ncbi:hypothetical protein GCM10010182_66870 [Actinomadura cremea]|nr:hypothetical protein GCM10010182_66870 [Actinomadura cremea]
MRPDETVWDLPPVTTGPPRRRPLTTVKTWYGHATGHFWAMVPWPAGEHGAVLVEAATEHALTAQINRIREQIR